MSSSIPLFSSSSKTSSSPTTTTTPSPSPTNPTSSSSSSSIPRRPTRISLPSRPSLRQNPPSSSSTTISPTTRNQHPLSISTTIPSSSSSTSTTANESNSTSNSSSTRSSSPVEEEGGGAVEKIEPLGRTRVSSSNSSVGSGSGIGIGIRPPNTRSRTTSVPSSNTATIKPIDNHGNTSPLLSDTASFFPTKTKSPSLSSTSSSPSSSSSMVLPPKPKPPMVTTGITKTSISGASTNNISVAEGRGRMEGGIDSKKRPNKLEIGTSGSNLVALTGNGNGTGTGNSGGSGSGSIAKRSSPLTSPKTSTSRLPLFADDVDEDNAGNPGWVVLDGEFNTPAIGAIGGGGGMNNTTSNHENQLAVATNNAAMAAARRKKLASILSAPTSPILSAFSASSGNSSNNSNGGNGGGGGSGSAGNNHKRTHGYSQSLSGIKLPSGYKLTRTTSTKGTGTGSGSSSPMSPRSPKLKTPTASPPMSRTPTITTTTPSGLSEASNGGSNTVNNSNGAGSSSGTLGIRTTPSSSPSSSNSNSAVASADSSPSTKSRPLLRSVVSGSSLPTMTSLASSSTLPGAFGNTTSGSGGALTPNTGIIAPTPTVPMASTAVALAGTDPAVKGKGKAKAESGDGGTGTGTGVTRGLGLGLSSMGRSMTGLKKSGPNNTGTSVLSRSGTPASGAGLGPGPGGGSKATRSMLASGTDESGRGDSVPLYQKILYPVTQTNELPDPILKTIGSTSTSTLSPPISYSEQLDPLIYHLLALILRAFVSDLFMVQLSGGRDNTDFLREVVRVVKEVIKRLEERIVERANTSYRNRGKDSSPPSTSSKNSDRKGKARADGITGYDEREHPSSEQTELDVLVFQTLPYILERHYRDYYAAKEEWESGRQDHLSGDHYQGDDGYTSEEGDIGAGRFPRNGGSQGQTRGLYTQDLTFEQLFHNRQPHAAISINSPPPLSSATIPGSFSPPISAAPSIASHHQQILRDASVLSSEPAGLASSTPSLRSLHMDPDLSILPPPLSPPTMAQIQKQYLRLIVTRLLEQLLPEGDFSPETEVFIIRDLLVNIIFGSGLFGKTAQGWFLMQQIGKALEEARVEREENLDAKAGSQRKSSRRKSLNFKSVLILFRRIALALEALVFLLFFHIFGPLTSFESSSSSSAPLLTPVASFLFTVFPPIAPLLPLRTFTHLSLWFLSPRLDPPFLSHFNRAMVNPAWMQKILRSATHALFPLPGGYPSPTPPEPTLEEQAQLRERAEKELALLIPESLSRMVDVDFPEMDPRSSHPPPPASPSEYPRTPSPGSLALAQRILEPLSSHACNVHLFMYALDVAVGFLFPEMIVSTS